MTGASSEWSASRLAIGQRGVRLGILCAALMALWGIGCSGGTEFPPPQGIGGGGSTGSGHTTTTGSGAAAGAACPDEGETRPCHASIGQVENLVNCYEGTELCYHGLWSECFAETYSLRQLPARLMVGAPKPLQASEASSTLPDLGDLAGLPGGGGPAQPLNATEQMCAGDPCDPTCRAFIEGGFTLGSGMTGSSLQWATATLTANVNAAAALAAKGLTTPGCSKGTDCQINQYCSYPITSAACAHDRCAPGVALDPTCDTCAASVCAQNPDCCTYAGPCAHAPCFPGAALTCNDSAAPPYDACVESVCLDITTAYCCDSMAMNAATAWDATCVAAYSACRPNPCPLAATTAWSSPLTYPGPSSAACTQIVHDACGLTCPTAQGTCSHDVCITGAALADSPASCDTGATAGCVASVCASQPSCCDQASGAWDASCVALIPALCGRSCPTTGVCAPIVQNQVDTACNGPDLTASIPCRDVGAQIPPSCLVDADCGSTTSGLFCNVSRKCQNGCRPSGNGCSAGMTCSNTVMGSSTPGNCVGCSVGTETAKCGGATSGRICGISTPFTNQCVFGCRGTGGNTCGPGKTCSSTTSAAGQCISYKVPDPANPGQFMMAPGDYVPVCNFGKAPTPPGSTVYLNVYGGGTGGIPGQPPGSNNGNVKTKCSTTQTIFPGKCVDVPCDTGSWGPATEIFVNPPSAPPGVSGYTRIQECNFQNNWTLNADTYQPPGPPTGSPVFCDSPSCASSLGKVNSHPVHLTIETEASSGAFFQWVTLRLGITSFLASGYSTTWAAIGSFPDNMATTCACTSGCVSTPPGMVKLPQGFGTPLSNALFMTPLAATSTPYLTAYQSALAFAIADKAASAATVPLNSAVVLVLTDDFTAQGSQCSPSTNSNLLGSMMAEAANAYTTTGVRTFVIAAPAVNSTALRNAAAAIASAGKGRSYYYPVTTFAQYVSLSGNVTNALQDIQNYAVSACSFDLPDPSLFDATNALILYTANSPTAIPLSTLNNIQPTTAQVTTAKAAGQGYLDACLLACQSAGPDGYCYDDYLPPSGLPTRLVLCPSTCGKIAVDPYPTTASTLMSSKGFASFTLGCPSAFVGGQGPPLTPYQGQCVGGPENGQKPLWTFLAYSATTPSDATSAVNIKFDVQTAQAVGGVCPTTPASYTPVKTAGIAKLYTGGGGWDYQNCPMNGSVANCPVDLVKLLNPLAAGAQPDGGTPSGYSINGPALADCMSLAVTLNTNANASVAPVLNGFELRYSCVSAE